ncbi:transcriptional regulator NrdR [Entomospira entomophila]|nr:transcriptional regulator NrdR [Entomospira entomophilus]WDI35704.1 transcriptional regulator NrdR [Entomospira entomophilus]
MYCPHCGADEMKVLETRESEMTNSIRRRRECLGCGRRFTSYESIKHPPITVLKKSGKKEPLSIEKIRDSLEVALRKRPINQAVIAQTQKEIERSIFSHASDRGYIDSQLIGQIILNQLKDLDATAYIRFASVYFSFSDVKAFISFIESMQS